MWRSARPSQLRSERASASASATASTASTAAAQQRRACLAPAPHPPLGGLSRRRLPPSPAHSCCARKHCGRGTSEDTRSEQVGASAGTCPQRTTPHAGCPQQRGPADKGVPAAWLQGCSRHRPVHQGALPAHTRAPDLQRARAQDSRTLVLCEVARGDALCDGARAPLRRHALALLQDVHCLLVHCLAARLASLAAW
jgi:hypothetical protein